METETIYVKLLDENVDVYRPVNARQIRDKIYRILPTDEYASLGEKWEFNPGSIVICRKDKLEGNDVLVATSLSKEALEQIETIRNILMTDWDPIGVSEWVEAKDEYDSYVYEIYSMFLKGGLSNGKIVEYLIMVSKDYMGLDSYKEKAESAAHKISSLLGI